MSKPRPVSHEEYTEGFTELVPGVFLSPDSIHIVDDHGEVCMWNVTEMEDESAFTAALTAVSLATKYGPAHVRTNLETQGDMVKQMLIATANYWK